MKIYLGLGTNLGDRELNLVEARDLLMKYDVLVVGQSEVRETEPLGALDQPMYLNQVVECQTELDPEPLVVACKMVEKAMGREVEVPLLGNLHFGALGGLSSTKKESNPAEWQSRIIDIDILFYDDMVLNTALVTIPHPRLHERDFVLQGMVDLAPDFVHPVLKRSMKTLLNGA